MLVGIPEVFASLCRPFQPVAALSSMDSCTNCRSRLDSVQQNKTQRERAACRISQTRGEVQPFPGSRWDCRHNSDEPSFLIWKPNMVFPHVRLVALTARGTNARFLHNMHCEPSTPKTPPSSESTAARALKPEPESLRTFEIAKLQQSHAQPLSPFLP